MEPFSLHALERVAELAPAALTAGGRVVDVAAGPGTLSLPLAARGADVEAIDFSSEMLAELTRLARERGLSNLHAREGDGMALPYEDASFDAGFSLFGLMFFPDRPRGFAELFRVLRPAGVAVVSAWVPAERSPLMRLMFGALMAADPNMPPVLPNLSSLENPEVFEAEMRAAGFSDVRIEPWTNKIPGVSAGEFWEKLTVSSAPLLLMRQRLGEDEWRRRSVVSQQYLETEFAGKRLDLEATALFGIGIKAAVG